MEVTLAREQADDVACFALRRPAGMVIEEQQTVFNHSLFIEPA